MLIRYLLSAFIIYFSFLHVGARIEVAYKRSQEKRKE
jgi:hypothetical protein